MLTDDNFPAAREVKFNAGYVSCLVDIAKEGINQPQVDSVDPRTTMLQVLAAGMYRHHTTHDAWLMNDLQVSYAM